LLKRTLRSTVPIVGLLALRAALCWAKPLALIDALSPFFDPDKAPVRSWSMPFAHLDLTTPPFADLAHLQRSKERFRAYCKHIRSLGYDGVILGNLIHLTLFDGVPEGPNVVYGRTDPYRLRHAAYKDSFRQMTAVAHALGLQVIVETDFPVWTPPVLRYLGERGLSLANPRLWTLYRAGIRELTEDLGVDGVSVRIGEGGGAYNDPLTRYASTVLIRNVEDAHRLIRESLAMIETINRGSSRPHRLFFRTWTIGLGPIGNLHTDPALYQRVFAPFYGRKNLVTVIKHVAMDFYDHVPRNPTIGIGGLPQIVEFQARREFEGFNLFPNYRGTSFREDIRFFQTLPQFAGISVWAANGGFLFKAPIFYGVSPHDEWIDLNVRAYASLLENPDKEARTVLEEWLVGKGLSEPDRAIAGPLLMRSQKLVSAGLYLREFARHKVGLLGLERIPPMLWLWWTRPSSAYGLQCLIFKVLRAEAPKVMAEGYEAVAEARSMVKQAESLSQSSFRDRLLESLLYEQSVLEVLAGYRAVFLNHYAWALNGSASSYDEWQVAARELEQSCRAHLTRYQNSRFFPPLDLRELDRMLRDDEGQQNLRSWAAIAACLSCFNIAWILKRSHSMPTWKALASGILSVALVSFSSIVFVAGYKATMVGGVSAALALSIWLLTSAAIMLIGGSRTGLRTSAFNAISLAKLTLVPLLLWQALMMFVFAVRGPVPIYWLMVSALDQSWARWTLLGAGTGWLIVWLFACSLVSHRALKSSWRRLSLTLGCMSATLLPPIVLAMMASRSLPLVNDIYRIGPSIFGEAGPGVKELSSVSLSPQVRTEKKNTQ